MRIEHTKKRDLTTTSWSGGTTTQLALFPANASYQKGDYQFRLSTAKVEAPTSNFTKLPGISRVIMILEGELELIHKDRYSKKLQQFDTDCFEGNWETSSVGQVVDYNLMTSKNASGNLSALRLKAGQEKSISLFEECNVAAYYCFSGEVEIQANQTSLLLSQGDIILFFGKSETETIKLLPKVACKLVEARIQTSL